MACRLNLALLDKLIDFVHPGWNSFKVINQFRINTPGMGSIDQIDAYVQQTMTNPAQRATLLERKQWLRFNGAGMDL